ncbi:MAG TPA: hypothetical protein VKA15_02750 [Isosphaeraceae bacterium]|nr:hypothetical protein [Isosphaeraceae bacterium]
MSRSANVLSTQTLKDFRITLCNFGEEARNALSGVEMELRRTRDWLERDQLGYWQAQVKRRQQQVMQARADLHKRKISQQGSDAVSDSEQKEALRDAERGLRIAEEKVDLIKKKLIPFLHHEIAEYHAHAQPLGDHLAGGFERSIASMEKMTAALESYLALRVPTAPKLDSGAESGAAATTKASSTADSARTAEAESPAEPPQSEEPTSTQPAGSPGTESAVGETLVSGRAS